MKKSLSYIFLFLSAALFFTACSGSVDNSASSYGLTVYDIFTANYSETLLKNCRSVKFESDFYNADGEITGNSTWHSGTIGGDNAVYYENSSGYRSFSYKNAEYVLESSDGTPGIIGLTDQDILTRSYNLTQNICPANEYCKVISAERQKGILVVTVEMPVNEVTEYISSAYSFSGCVKYKYVYELNADSLIISNYSVYGLTADGTETLVGKHKLYLQSTDIAYPDYVEDIMDAENTRTCKIIIDPGLDSEQSYSYIVPTGVRFGYHKIAGYGVYLDAEATVPIDSSLKYSGDLTLYFISNR